MAKQYLTTHTIENAHPSDIFSLAVTPTHILSASGSASLKVHSTVDADFPLVQTLRGAHKLGCHHVVTSADGSKAASAGFEGDIKVWRYSGSAPDGSGSSSGGSGEGNGQPPSINATGIGGEWVSEGAVVDGNKAGEVWALALSADGQYLASTTYNGRINVWDTSHAHEKIREYDTKGSFGLCIDLSSDGRFTASGHESGRVYTFNNDTGRMLHSLPGLIKPVRTVAFSPAGRLLAAAGDAMVIAIYDVYSGEQVTVLAGHAAWIFSVDWSHTGEYLLSGSFDGKVKVWSLETRTCVATHTEMDKAVWSAKWLPPPPRLPPAAAAANAGAGAARGRSEMFAVAGANRSISFYREATGG